MRMAERTFLCWVQKTVCSIRLCFVWIFMDFYVTIFFCLLNIFNSQPDIEIKKLSPWEFFPFINRFLKKAFRFRIFGHLRVLKRLQNVFSSIIWCAATYTQVAKENLFKSFLADPNIWQNANRSVEQIELSRILHSQLILRFVFYYEWKLLTCGSQNRYNCENMKINKISWVPLKYWIELSNFFN